MRTSTEPAASPSAGVRTTASELPSCICTMRTLAPAENAGETSRIELSRPINPTWLSGLPQRSALAPCTSTFSEANHSTPFVMPKHPLCEIRAASAVRIREYACECAASLLLSCVSAKCTSGPIWLDTSSTPGKYRSNARRSSVWKTSE